MNRLDYTFVTQIKSLPFVQEVWLYGSRAREDHHPRSDIDLAISCPNASDEDWQKVLEIIEEADTLLKIDVIRLDTLDDNKLKQNIETDKVLL